MSIITFRGDSPKESAEWVPIPFFPGYEINSNRHVRLCGDGVAYLREQTWGEKQYVSLRDEETGRMRRLDTAILWSMATCSSADLPRYELAVRPDAVYHGLLADCLSKLASPESLEKMSTRDMISLLKFLESLKEQTSKPKAKVTSIDAMRKYAQRLEESERERGEIERSE